MKNMPKKYLNTKDREEMWKEAKKILNKLEPDLEEVYAVGSVISNKKSPGDIDFAIVTKSKKQNPCFPVDLLIVPQGEDAKEYLEYIEKYMKKKHGKAFKPVRLK
ncbi:nucleotidyltransferase domain-containing protein [Candidatus Woesearchaeota archaeon]|nr:nucleotidyltransferase domain-containing protein [Candidatus Woesearchaeota archaeon]MBW3022193.1 nucleotidyltransferase domain-containing protein [Candidatus Woesearchaeota archaeon]